MNRVKKILNAIIPSYAVKPLIVVGIFNMFVYYGSRLINDDKTHYNMEIGIDGKIPLLPWMIIIYFGCYAFWVANYILCCRLGKEYAVRFCMTDILAEGICFLFFILLPTTMIRPDITGDGLMMKAMSWLYSIDAADNLFPSIHCLVSWICYIGIRGRSDVPKAYRIFSCIFAILVCVSTVTVKQHVIVDVAAGVILAELAYAVCFRIPIKNPIKIKNMQENE